MSGRSERPDPTFDARVKVLVYGFFAETGRSPRVEEIAGRVGCDRDAVCASYDRLLAAHAFLPEVDADEGEPRIRIAPPFSGVPTQHVVESAGVRYYANCAWDCFGIPVVLDAEARVRSRCEQSGEALELVVGDGGPELDERHEAWRFHSLVSAAHWWDDLTFT